MESEFEKLSLSDFKPSFEEYTIKTKIEEDLEGINLPQPSDLNQLILLDSRKLISFDKEKYLSFFQPNKIIDLSSNNHIQDTTIRNSLCMLLGGINSKTWDLTKYYEKFPFDVESDCYFDNSNNYSSYIEKNKLFITYNMKKLSEVDELYKALIEVGFTFKNGEKNSIFNSIRETVMNQDRICIIVSGSDNFWIKSDKSIINGISNDIKLNNYSYLFFNKNFIEKFIQKIIHHPRCYFCFVSSMTFKNLKKIRDALDTEFPKEFKNSVIFDQNTHINLNEGNKKEKPIFVRDFDKIKHNLKTYQKIDDFDERNVLFFESEKDKVNNTEHNSIIMNTFSERNLEFSKEEKEQFEKYQDKIINYIVKLLDECKCDIREYIKNNPLN